ncbi:hypothetical protein IU429_29350 [Nocardia elegans]|uniref:Uncharacterized protein n=1 Tax=Nocardia elegans TaxID=300029 RepID=A0ABW6TL29_9NOCA|nr:hypothetical protein [Nocardia elegans]MBF6451775.1 hypothetical protein [Nocardia elegans]
MRTDALLALALRENLLHQRRGISVGLARIPLDRRGQHHHGMSIGVGVTGVPQLSPVGCRHPDDGPDQRRPEPRPSHPTPPPPLLVSTGRRTRVAGDLFFTQRC